MANFLKQSLDIVNAYKNDLLQSRVVNDWEHITNGSDILSLSVSTSSFSGTLTTLPVVGSELRTKDSNFIYRYRITSITPSGNSFTGTMLYVDKFPLTIFGTISENNCNDVLSNRVRWDLKQDEIEMDK